MSAISKLRPPTVALGSYTLVFECSQLGDEYEQRAAQELRETPDVVPGALQGLRELLADQEDLYIPVDDDEFLFYFLRPCKFYPQSAFQRMMAFYRFKQKHHHLTSNLIPSAVEVPFYHNVFTVLPSRDQHGRRMVILHVRRWKTNKFSLEDLFRSIMLILELAVSEPRTQICGGVVILDLDGLSMSHVMQLSPSFAMTILHWLQDCIPVRLKAIHIVNQPYLFNMAYAVFKPFIRAKLRSRLHFHGKNRESLHRHIDPKFLPTYFGGEMDLPDARFEEIVKLFSAYDEYFEERCKYGFISEKAGHIENAK